MTATIQQILKPTRARGLDTSGSLQAVSQNMISNGDFASGDLTSWDAVSVGAGETAPAYDSNDGVSSSGCCIIDVEDGGYIGISQNLTYEAGSTYKVTLSAKAASGDSGKKIRVQDMSSGSESALKLHSVNNYIYTLSESHQTFTTTWTPTADSTGLYIVRDTGSGDWEFFVDNIEVIKLESFGNNNHAQIYSGRGLYFDGVTDYLTVNGGDNVTFVDWSEQTTQADKAWTIAFWVKLNANESSFKRITGNASSIASYIAITSQEKLGVYSLDDADWQIWDPVLTLNTWYRVVVVFDGSTKLTAYLNGVSVGDKTITEPTGNNGDLLLDRIGDDNGDDHFNGWLSDFQAWQGAWTADDASYDYLNPEQLVLNRGGLSLTNSNLKLWYPMNDGHRGNQSYVLDASNTGLGDDLVNWSSTFNASGTSTDDFGSWTTNANDSTTFCTFDHDNKTIRIRSTDGTHVQAFYTPDILKYGVIYRFEVTVSEITTGSLRVRPQNASGYSVITEVGTHSYLITPSANVDGSGNLTDLDFRIERNSGAADFTISDVKIYPINDKHNATTVFYGDDLFDAGVGDYGDSTGGWTAEGNNLIANDSSALKITFVDADDGARLDLNDAEDLKEDLVLGRTYRLRFTYKINQVSGDNVTLQVNQGDNTFATTGTLNQTSFTSLSKDFTCAGTATSAEIKFNNLSSGDILHVKDFDLKEIGIASGWTDADQQLDIPQTALQSYNQLGYNHIYNAGNAPLTTAAYTPNFGTDNFCVSFAIFPTDLSQDMRFMAIRQGGGRLIFQLKGSSNNEMAIYLEDADNNTLSGAYQIVSKANAITEGKWHHILLSINRSDDTAKMYINGVYQEIAYDISGITGNINGGGTLEFYSFSGDTDCFIGAIDEIAFWKGTAFSEATIGELYNDGKALDPRNHSLSSTLINYWKNEGLGLWQDKIGTAHVATNRMTETMLITAGADSSRDSQGFLMNRQRTTNSANIAVLAKHDGTNDEGSYIYLPDNPLYTGSAVTNYTISFWVKFAVNPTDLDHNMHFIDTLQSDANRTFKIHITSGGVIYLYTYYGSSAGNESVYCDYGFPSKLGNAIQIPPVNTNAGIGEAFDVNNWYHLTWTFDHDRTTGSGTADNTNATSDADSNFTPYFFYINGIQVAAEGREGANSAMTTARSMQSSNTPVMIGTAIGSSTIPETGSQKDFKGQIDDICFYSDTLTDEEVLRNYNAGKRSHR